MEKQRKETETVDDEIIYMDCNATSPLAPSVINAIHETLHTGWANPSSSYRAGMEAKRIVTKARQQLLTLVNGRQMSEITFTSGGTEANNHVIWMTLKYFDQFSHGKVVQHGFLPHIITSTIEHDSILKPLQQLEKEGKARVSYVEVSPHSGYVDAKDVVNEVCDQTVLVTIMMANNETGVIQRIKEICTAVRSVPRQRGGEELPRIIIHTDAAQSIGKIPVDVQQLKVDALTIVGHKFYGPRIGALWVGEGTPFFPMLLGGGQEEGRRAGTENTPMIAGLGEAARLVTSSLDKDAAHFTEVRNYLVASLEREFGKDVVRLNSSEHQQERLPNTANISFLNSSLNGRQILQRCRRFIASVGAACHSADSGMVASTILLKHHVSADIATRAIRFSVGRHTTCRDVDIVVEDLRQAFLM